MDNLIVIAREDIGQRALRASRHYGRGETVASFEASEVVGHPTYLTVQVREGEHIVLQPAWLEFINHGCDPNVHFDMAARRVTCVRDITAGDELLYFYPSTEWSMVQPFDCRCGSARCIGLVQGAAALAPSVLARYALSPYVAGRLGDARAELV